MMTAVVLIEGHGYIQANTATAVNHSEWDRRRQAEHPHILESGVFIKQLNIALCSLLY